MEKIQSIWIYQSTPVPDTAMINYKITFGIVFGIVSKALLIAMLK
jgi:hypothetical protein